MKQEIIQYLSFWDTSVLKMDLSLNDKKLKIFVGAVLIKDNSTNYFGSRTDMILGNGFLVFEDWSDLTVILNTSDGKKIVDLSPWELDPLEDILIFDQIENRVEISGFGIENYDWEKWTIVGSQYYGEFDEYEQS